MPDYRQETGTANAWRRASTITIHNPLGGTPSIVFHEEDAVEVNGKKFRASNAAQVTGFFDPAATFPLVHPLTGDVIGTGSQMEFQVLLHSLYLKLAGDRDAALAAPTEP
jgi:hypothetical protein